MLKRIASAITVLIIILGFGFLVLNILDINEDYRLSFSIPVLNTIFIFALSLFIACLAARQYSRNSSLPVLVLGGAALAFGTGSLFKAWMGNLGLGMTITVDESTALFASILFILSSILFKIVGKIENPIFSSSALTVIGYYLAVLLCFSVIVIITMQNVIPAFSTASGSSGEFRDVVRGITAIFLLTSAGLNIYVYIQFRNEFHYWYFLGLLLLAFGVLFLSQGAVQSKIAWLGRTAQYFGFVFLVVCIFVRNRIVSN